VKKVLLFSLLLVGGLAGSQMLPALAPGLAAAASEPIRLATMLCLAFIMIHVGYEFEIDRTNLRAYAVDYGVAATAAAFPWIFSAVYFVVAFGPPGAWTSADVWKESLLAGRFAAPTSAGVLFAMLAAAGLSASWLFQKARVLAIFDDLDTVLLMIPLKALIVGLRWQLGVVILLMAVLVWLAWRYLHMVRWPVSWPWVMGYAVAITLASELIYLASRQIDDVVPVHIEVLLPAFVLGCMLARPAGHDPHRDDARDGHQEGPESHEEQRVSAIIAAVFMVFVGLSMPSLSATGVLEEVGWTSLLWHTLIVTVLANAGKMLPAFFYRDEAPWRERVALAIGMWPRGEVGAGVLVVSLSYGIGGPMIAVAALSLALNLLLTGPFIYIVKKLVRPAADAPAPGSAA
jgi:Kef-type K+ transport system membrane component KefB